MRLMKVDAETLVAVNAEAWDHVPEVEGFIYVQSADAVIGSIYDPNTGRFDPPEDA